MILVDLFSHCNFFLNYLFNMSPQKKKKNSKIYLIMILVYLFSHFNFFQNNLFEFLPKKKKKMILL